MEVKEELLIDRWFGSCLLGFGFSSVRLDGRKVRASGLEDKFLLLLLILTFGQ
jgi:hypothetical protein